VGAVGGGIATVDRERSRLYPNSALSARVAVSVRRDIGSSAGDLLVAFGWTPRRQRSVYAAWPEPSKVKVQTPNATETDPKGM
jgi:hypothetical protein